MANKINWGQIALKMLMHCTATNFTRFTRFTYVTLVTEYTHEILFLLKHKNFFAYLGLECLFLEFSNKS